MQPYGGGQRFPVIASSPAGSAWLGDIAELRPGTRLSRIGNSHSFTMALLRYP
jgi:hypothetical protein